MAQKFLGLIGALDVIWPLGRWSNYVGPYKSEESGVSGMAQTLLGLIGSLEVVWP